MISTAQKVSGFAAAQIESKNALWFLPIVWLEISLLLHYWIIFSTQNKRYFGIKSNRYGHSNAYATRLCCWLNASRRTASCLRPCYSYVTVIFSRAPLQWNAARRHPEIDSAAKIYCYEFTLTFLCSVCCGNKLGAYILQATSGLFALVSLVTYLTYYISEKVNIMFTVYSVFMPVWTLDMNDFL